MSNKKISELPEAGSLTNDDLFAVVQGVSPDLITKKIKFSNLQKDINVRIPSTAADLRNLISSEGLSAGSIYIIDFQTKHLIPNTSVIHTGTTEQLAVYALSSNSVSNLVVSSDYPNDVILLDINDTTCEDDSTSRDGKIIYRKDTVKNLETWYDFRNVVFRRWQLDVASNASSAWAASTNYGVGDMVCQSGIFYRCMIPHTSAGAFDQLNWQIIAYEDNNSRVAWNNTITMMGCTLNANTLYWDLHTFTNEDCKDISIGRMFNGGYNNIVFQGAGSPEGTQFDENCSNISIVNAAPYNRFGKNCSSIIMGNHAVSNRVGDNSSQLYLFNGPLNNRVLNSASRITIIAGAVRNTVEEEASLALLEGVNETRLKKASYNNKVQYSSSYSEIGYYSGSNILTNGAMRTVVGNDSHNNLFTNGSTDIQLGNNCNSNSFNNSSSRNRLGNNCSSNTFVSSSDNILANNCAGNVFTVSASNQLGNHTSNNTLKNASYNIFGNNCNANLLDNMGGSNNTHNHFGNGASSNTLFGNNHNNYLGNGCYSNRISLGSSGNYLDASCANNDLAYSLSASTGGYSFNRLGANCANLLVRGNNNVFESGCASINLADATSNCYFTSGVQNKTFNISQNGLRFEVRDVAVKTYTGIYHRTTANMQSPDGTIWYQAVDNSGVATINELV